MSVLPTAKASSAAVVVLVLLVSIYMITLRGTNKSNGSSSRSKPSSRSTVHLHPLNLSPFLGANNFYFSVCSVSTKVTD